MRSAICLVVAFVAFGCINAQFINWDALNGDSLAIIRPNPPKRPAPPARPPDSIDQDNQNQVPPIVGGNGNSWNLNGGSLNVQVITTDEDQNGVPPTKNEVNHRPFEPAPYPPTVDQPTGPILPPPGPPQPEPKPQPQQRPETKPIHLEINLNRPGHSGASLEIVGDEAEPTPKYPYRPRQ